MAHYKVTNVPTTVSSTLKSLSVVWIHPVQCQ